MTRRPCLPVLAAAAAIVLAPLCACKQTAALNGEAPEHGRYVGVGIYSPSRQWTQMVMRQKPQDDGAARPIDDQVVIVTADSQTGEFRACGDLTGYCIGMNPWSRPLAAGQVAPIELTGHVASGQPDVTVTVEGTPRRAGRHPYKPASSPRSPLAAVPAES